MHLTKIVLMVSSCFVFLTACSYDILGSLGTYLQPSPTRMQVALPQETEEKGKNPAVHILPSQSEPVVVPMTPTAVVSPSLESLLGDKKTEIPAPQKPDRNLKVLPRPDIAYNDTLLVEDTLWRGEVQVTGWVTIPSHVTLTVEAGTIIRFLPDRQGENGGGILVQGRLLVNGLPDKPVTFTGAYRESAASDWQGIVFLATEKKNLMESSRVEWASAGLDAFHSVLSLKNVTVVDCETGFRFRDSYVSILSTAVSSCSQAIVSTDSEVEIKDASITGNRSGVSVAGGALVLSGSSLYGNDLAAVSVEKSRVKVSANSFTLNGTGLQFDSCDGAVIYNRILKNREVGLVLNNSRIKVNANEVSQNGTAGIRVTHGASTLWGNSLFSNGGCALVYNGGSVLPAMGNWWGDLPRESIQSKICCSSEQHPVLFRPVLLSRPNLAF